MLGNRQDAPCRDVAWPLNGCFCDEVRATGVLDPQHVTSHGAQGDVGRLRSERLHEPSGDDPMLVSQRRRERRERRYVEGHGKETRTPSVETQPRPRVLPPSREDGERRVTFKEASTKPPLDVEQSLPMMSVLHTKTIGMG